MKPNYLPSKEDIYSLSEEQALALFDELQVEAMQILEIAHYVWRHICFIRRTKHQEKNLLSKLNKPIPKSKETLVEAILEKLQSTTNKTISTLLN